MSRATRKGSKSAAPVFAALGDEARLELVRRLCNDGPQSITALTREAGRTRQAVTKHLRIMERSGVARCTRRGRESIWRIRPHSIEQARQHLERISRQWDAALDRLQLMVEGPPD
ncbi:MAG: metalloregulator ArsR/SmtB family transcription factor [Bryobacteraceae bacterium]|nr:metalloregulator ArsR/SmtB family transcription factor [Bryobacteraceae bacterium]